MYYFTFYVVDTLVETRRDIDALRTMITANEELNLCCKPHIFESPILTMTDDTERPRGQRGKRRRGPTGMRIRDREAIWKACVVSVE